MHTLVYDGTFEGFLSAVFDQYYYKFTGPHLVKEADFQQNIFAQHHTVRTEPLYSKRVWDGLQKKLSTEAQQQLYQTFLSELPGIENTLLQYVQYVFDSTASVETDYSHPAVLTVQQTAKKVWREKHRMEAFVRFQQTADNLYYAIIEPDYDVLPLISVHFKTRYQNQRWLIWDARRQYGIYFDLNEVTNVQMSFAEEAGKGKNIKAVYDEKEEMYQQLWQQYFKSVNIAARKNTKLHLQHMPARYWKYLPEKSVGSFLQK